MHASLVSNWTKCLATDTTNASLAVVVPTLTRPATSTIKASFERGRPGTGQRFENILCVAPFGGDTNNDVINVKVQGWNQTPLGLWFPTLVCEISCTLSSALPGLAAREVVVANFFADTLSKTKGIAHLLQGTADIDIAYFKCIVSGFEVVDVAFSLGANADRCNALVRFDQVSFPLEV